MDREHIISENWIARQALAGNSQFDRAMAKAYPESEGYLQGGKEYLNTIGEVCNYIAAAELVNWNSYFPAGAKVLDLGCGGGWLTAMLSVRDAVETVYALDSSRHFLHNLLPAVVGLMAGNEKKIVPIEALFQPLLFEDGVLDVVVASSVLHHADNLESLLLEIQRVLRPGGRLVVLNETPVRGWRHLVSVAAAAMRILCSLVLLRYEPVSPSISASGYLYDPKLGDRDYPLWYWHTAFSRAGFSVESTINLGMPTVKNGRGRSLVHFICRKN